MAEDDVPAHPPPDRRRPLEMDAGAERQGAQGRLGERLGAHVALEAPVEDAIHGEAGAVDVDRLPEGEGAEGRLDEGARHRPAGAAAEDAYRLDEAGEQS